MINLTNTIQPQMRPIGVERTQLQEGTQNITDKLKTQPEYIPTIQEEAVIKAIETANQKLKGGEKEFKFSIHEQTKQIMVKVIDTSTKEVIKELPPEKILDMVASMCEAAGLFIDEKG